MSGHIDVTQSTKAFRVLVVTKFGHLRGLAHVAGAGQRANSPRDSTTPPASTVFLCGPPPD